MSHLPNPVQIKRENDSDQEDVVFLETVPTFEHRPEEYDTECKCRMCLIVRKLLAKCTCEDCRATGQHSLDHHVNQVEEVGQVAVQATENVTHDNEGEPTNALPSSSINSNASISEHANLTNKQDDQSRSSTLNDNQPRFFDNESKSGDLSDLDDDEEVDVGDKDRTGLDQKIDRDADANSSDPDYDSLMEQIPRKCLKRKIHSKRSNSKSIKNSKTISQSQKGHKCPHCNKRFSTKDHLSRHHRTKHLQLKTYNCKWHKCDFVTGRRDNMVQHIVDTHFNKRNDNETVNHYIGKCDKKEQVVQSTGENNITLDNEVETSIKVSTELLNEVSTSCGHISENDNDDQSRSSTPDYPPRFFDDDKSEIRDSSSNDDDQVEGRDEDEFEFDQESDDDDDDDEGDKDYKASEEDSDSDDDDSSDVDNSDDNRDDNSSDSDYVLSKVQSLKRSHSKSRSRQTSKHTKSTKSAKKHDFEQTEGRRKRKRFKPKTCPKCKRVLYSGHLKNHLRTHKKWGISCKWPKCGFFYPALKEAKQHLWADHLQNSTVELTNAQVCQYLVRLNPATGETSRIKRLQEGGHNLGGHPQPSKDPNARQMDTFDCPKCEASFAERGRLLRHYRGSHQKWKPFYCKWPECSFKHSIHDRVLRHADIQHFNKANRAKARTYVGERASPSKKDPVYEQLLRDTSFNQNCTTCGRNFRMPSHYAQHLATHKKSGFRCTWQQRCGFFYGSYFYAKQHILEDHLKGELVNEHQINKNLVKVEPKKGHTNKKQKTNRLAALDTDEDENSNSENGRGSKSKMKKHKKS